MIPDPLRLAVALVPVASYLLLIGLLNIRRRPFLTTGGGDLAALGAALSGLVLVGPIELFCPEAASAKFGGYVWFFLLVFYWLWVWLAVLLARPRLVIYNISGEELRPLLAETARALDPQSRWAGDSLSLPTLGVQMHVETSQIMRNALLIASGPKQNLAGWRKMAAQLHKRIKRMQVTRSPRALGIILLACMLLVASICHMLADPQRVAQAMREMLTL
jgi:hypothetical protein